MRTSSNSGFPIEMLVWLALLSSVGLYAVVGFVLAPAVADSGVTLPPWIMPFVAGLLTVVSLLFFRSVSEGGSGDAARSGAGPIDARLVAGWALDESVAVVGLVSLFLGGNLKYFVVYLVVAAGLLLLHRPRS